ncbi:hypothetical protein [Faucicola boevrei]|uniref:hypothetical protein n=2 Tax=Faucicola boevrei TaxID=346665 RepID=UPI0003666B38|nr:hypothetical protein [Moraxella boevrei]
MPSKKEILEYTKQNEFVYPKEKVILGFTLLGGMVGGFIFGLGIMLVFIIGDIINNKNILTVNSFVELLLSLLSFSLVGLFVGGIPALITGIYLAMTEFIIINKKDYLSLLLTGGIITIFICLILIFLKTANEASLDFGVNLILLILFFIGGLSAMICGKLFLPKLPKDFEQ